ncbi:MAG: DsbE family thiol:disulfide interchange protein [Paracoccaceae bacterium]
MKIRPLMLLPPLIFIGFAVFAGFGMFRDNPDSLPSARQGQVVPSMTVDAMPGKETFDADTLKGGGVKLVNFWASWCAPCRAEHPNFTQLAQEGVPIYGVNYRDSESKAMAFLDELGDPYIALAADPQGRTGLDWGLYGVPETYVIDNEGVIVLRFAGPVTQRVLHETIRPAMEAAAAD